MGIRLAQTFILGLVFTLGTTLLLSASANSEDLRNAVVAGDLEFLESQKSIQLFAVSSGKSESLLVLASQWRQTEVVNFILKGVGTKSSYLEIEDSNGKTALHYAAFYGREDIALGLLRKGAKASSVDKSLLVELMNNTEIRDLVLEQKEGVASTSLRLPSRSYKLTVQKIQIKKGSK